MNRQLIAFLSLFSLTLVLSVYYVLIPKVNVDNTISNPDQVVNGEILDAQAAYFENLSIERDSIYKGYYDQQNNILSSSSYSNLEKENALKLIEEYKKEEVQLLELENCVKCIGYQNVFVEYINSDIHVITSCIDSKNEAYEAAQIIFTIQDLLDKEENIFIEFHN